MIDSQLCRSIHALMQPPSLMEGPTGFFYFTFLPCNAYVIIPKRIKG